MTVWPTPPEDEQLTPLFLHTWGVLLGGPHMHSFATSFTPNNGAWTTANQAIYVPFRLPFPYVVRRLFWHVGSVGNSGNSDIGIYSLGGTAIFTAGSTVNSTGNTPQYITPASPIVLSPGRYFLAYSHSSISANHIFGRGGIVNNGLTGCYTQLSAVPLPGTATFAPTTALNYPLMGITRTASGF